MKQPKAPKTPKHAPHHPAVKANLGPVTSTSRRHPAPAPASHHHQVTGHGKGKKPKPAPKPKPAKKPHQKRQWSPGADVACCAAEAFGQIVIASGAPWSAEQTLTLYGRTAGHPDAGASVLATLEAAGVPGERIDKRAANDDHHGYQSWGHGLILGVTLPQPHAVAVTPDGTWWSWGEPFDPGAWPELEIDEAWAVQLWPR